MVGAIKVVTEAKACGAEGVNNYLSTCNSKPNNNELQKILSC